MKEKDGRGRKESLASEDLPTMDLRIVKDVYDTSGLYRLYSEALVARLRSTFGKQPPQLLTKPENVILSVT